VTNDNHVVCGDMRFAAMAASRCRWWLGDQPLRFDAGGVRGVVDPGASHLLVRGVDMQGALATPAAAARGISVCGTGPGQTPFTIGAGAYELQRLQRELHGFLRCDGRFR
jgi:hypothetical protein